MQMDLQDYTKLLRRQILDGSRFNHLFPKADKKIKYFEKSTQEELESDVFDTLQFMDEWTRKFSWQVRKFAPILKGDTVEQTCSNIFRFLHDYFQYKLDNDVQDLHNPASAWANRETGFDCKSFSILAGALLIELNIPFSFRMAKQKGVKSEQYPYEWIINPNHWTHVYVVVHTNNNNIVIDATTHDNKEVPTIKIHDHKMKHRGLSMASVTGLGCSCTGTSVQKTGLGNPSTLNAAISNFHSFLDVLESNGVPRTVTNRMIELVKFNVQKGIDPNMGEIMQKAFAPTPDQGLGFSLAETGAGAVNQAAGSISIGGSSISTIGGAIAGDPASISAVASNLVTKIIPMGFINKTFGAVFANGLNLSCWGASLTPSMATDRLSKTYQPYFNNLVNAIDSAQTMYAKEIAINRFLKDITLIHNYYKFLKIKEADWSGCAKKAITGVYTPFFDAIKTNADKLVAELVSKGAVKTTIEVPYEKYTIQVAGQKLYTAKKPVGGTVPQIKLNNFDGGAQITNNGNGTVTITNNGETKTITVAQYEAATGTKLPTNTTQNPNINNNSNNNPIKEPKTSSSGTTLLLGGGAILLLKLLL